MEFYGRYDKKLLLVYSDNTSCNNVAIRNLRLQQQMAIDNTLSKRIIGSHVDTNKNLSFLSDCNETKP